MIENAQPPPGTRGSSRIALGFVSSPRPCLSLRSETDLLAPVASMIIRSQLLPRFTTAFTRRYASKATRAPPRKKTYIPNAKPSERLLWAGLQATLVYHFTFTYVAEISACYGESMIPTISLYGDWVLINKWYRHGRGVKVGDVVDFIKPTDPSFSVVKRIIGMPGDFVVSDYADPGEEKKSALQLIRGRDDEGWELVAKDKKDEESEKKDQMMLQVPEGHCWVLGDNLSESRDSRLYGPVPLALIKGKIVAKVLPLNEMGWIRNNLDAVNED